MQPTYSFQEIKSLIRSLDSSSATVLEELVEEEKECYPEEELRAFCRFKQLKNTQPTANAVKAEFLLSFN